jgi:hypothetical protein
MPDWDHPSLTKEAAAALMRETLGQIKADRIPNMMRAEVEGALFEAPTWAPEKMGDGDATIGGGQRFAKVLRFDPVTRKATIFIGDVVGMPEGMMFEVG